MRALVANPRLLILDEATSAVDSRTEERLQSALLALVKGRTAFVVAHRLSTVQHADRILVVDGGRIVESGTHGELLERKRPLRGAPPRVRAGMNFSSSPGHPRPAVSG